MKCFIIIGMPAAGKDIARQFARLQGYPYFATGDIVRAEASRRGVSPDADSMARLSTELRGSDGLGVTRLALSTAVASGSAVVFMEGIRSKQEIDLIGAQAETVVVAFLAPRSIEGAGTVPGPLGRLCGGLRRAGPAGDRLRPGHPHRAGRRIHPEHGHGG